MTAVTWQEAAMRLALAALGGAAIGFNRGLSRRGAGLRTTLLVCLAAAVSMLQANVLLFTRGRAPDAFVSMDVMRLPLGILSGVGFIGAGAILHNRRGFARGVTTAATLWYVTVMGLCFGGGQISLGLAATALGLGVLWGLKLVERRWPQEHRARLVLHVQGPEGPSAEEVTRRLAADGYRVRRWTVVYAKTAGEHRLRGEVRWRAHSTDFGPTSFVQDFARQSGITRVEWRL